MKNIWFFLTGIMLLSCDPMRRIYIKNNSNDIAEITWVIKEDSILCSPLFISNNPEVRFQLAPDPGKSINMSCGIGEWNPGSLAAFVDDLESVELKWTGGHIKMTNTDSIKNYLLHRRIGLGNGTICIRFSNPPKH